MLRNHSIRAIALSLAAIAAAGPASRAPTARADGSRDWPRFGYDVGGTNSSSAPSGITAANVGSLRRQQVAIDGTVDASAIYLHGAMVNGAAHDAFFVTTSYGITIAIDADNGAVLWRHVPAGYTSWEG